MAAPLADDGIPLDTQAVLLLCAAFGKQSDSEAKPLTLRDYNAVAKWLGEQNRRPADLLDDFQVSYPADDPELPEAARVQALLGRGMQMAAAVERWQRLGLWVVSRPEERYPERLRRTLRSSAPPLLFGAGDRTRLTLGGLALVGSRDAEDDDLAFTRRVAERCAGAGMQILSGGARGVDVAALSGALEAGGGVVAVLSDRLDRTATSRDAKEPIRAGLLTVISPYEPDANFTIGRAMGRNKDIYGLADYALVVRFTKGEGGSWAGAVEQLGRNRPEAVGVPVFFRVAKNPEEACRDLQGKGALAFPEEDFFNGDVAKVLGQARTPTTGQAELWG